MDPEKVIEDERKKDEIWAKETVVNSPWGNYTIWNLRKAFDKVAPKDNWKNPINTIVDGTEDVSLILSAIQFMTGSTGFVTLVSRQDGQLAYRIEAAGYYATIGA